LNTFNTELSLTRFLEKNAGVKFNPFLIKVYVFVCTRVFIYLLTNLNN